MEPNNQQPPVNSDFSSPLLKKKKGVEPKRRPASMIPIPESDNSVDNNETSDNNIPSPFVRVNNITCPYTVWNIYFSEKGLYHSIID